MTVKEMLRRRPVTLAVAATTVLMVVGVAVEGWDFILTPLPIPEKIVGYWFTFNLVLSLMAFFLIWRNLNIFESHWTWQELMFLRGVLLFVYGSSLGYLARAFSEDPTATLGTFFSTAGLMLLIYGALRKPERFEDPNGSSH